MKFEIRNRWTAAVIFECEADSIRLAVELAVSKRVSLSAADLRAANLRAADLRAADLRDADLRAANLSDADLRAANLSDANLRAANLRDANLSDANLRDANLRDANLRDAKEDFLAVLTVAKNEVIFLYKAIIDGRVDGSQYRGECACLVGTIAHARKEAYDELKIDLRPQSERPAEKLFLAIRRGDTPANNAVSAIVADWTREWAKENKIDLPERTVSWSDGTESKIP